MSGPSASARLRIGIDTGGTFTDIVSVDIVSGATQVTKVASTPANPAIGLLFIIPGIDELLRVNAVSAYAGKRAKKGKSLDFPIKATMLVRE